MKKTHDPVCLHEIGKCDCGFVPEDWKVTFDHMCEENEIVFLTKLDETLIKQFIRQLLVKRSKRI